MRIVFATTEFITEEENFDGGLSNYLSRVTRYFKEFGHIPIVLISADINERFYFNGVEVIRFENKQHWWFWLMNAMTIGMFNPVLVALVRSYNCRKAIRKIDKEKKIDIIQYTSSMSIGFLKMRNIPSVTRISGLMLLKDRPQGLRYVLKNPQKQKLQHWNLRWANALYSPSKFMSSAIKNAIGREVAVIESPYKQQNLSLDMSNYECLMHEIHGQPYLLYFGTLSLKKGIKEIGDLIFDLLEKRQKLYFVFVGKDYGIGKIKAIDYVLDKAKEHSARIIYYDRMGHSNLFPIIQGADLVVLPSRLDNFPNACLEAMALKKVVIGTYASSMEEQISDGIDGFLCQNSNSNSLYDTIQKALNLSTSQKNEIENKAYIKIRKLHPSITVNKLITFYEKVIRNFQ